MNKILESTKYVVDRSDQVKIDADNLLSFCKTFKHENLVHWLSAGPIDFSSLKDEEKINLLFLYSSLSFCYWGDPPWTVDYNDQKFNGSWAMLASLMRAVDDSSPLFNPKYRASISPKDLTKIFRGSVEVPLFDRRLKFIRETGSVLLEKYGGSFLNILVAANGDAMKLLDLLIDNFSAYNDIAEYKVKKVYFYKKAQLLISDIYQLFNGKGYGSFSNIDQITALADYRLPQVMRKLGLLKYSEELNQKIDQKVIIVSGSQDEVEIRANTIWVVQNIYEEIKKSNPQILPIGINDHFWLFRRLKYTDDQIHHRTLTTAY